MSGSSIGGTWRDDAPGGRSTSVDGVRADDALYRTRTLGPVLPSDQSYRLP